MMAKIKRRYIFLLLVVSIALLFIFFNFSTIYIWSGKEHPEDVKSLYVKPEYSQDKSECVEKAVKWLSSLSAEPIVLNRRGMKGKKHFMEKLFAFYQLHQHTAKSKEKEMYRNIVEKMLKITESEGYHLSGDNEELLKSEIVSYLHACYLKEQLGYDCQNYKRRIRELLPVIKRHMSKRNTSIQLMILYLLKYLGFEVEYYPEQIFKNTLTYNIKGLGTFNIFDFKYNSYMLGICHEIFAISEYGRKDVYFLTEKDKHYLKNIFKSSIEQVLSSKDIRYLDLLAEMLVSLKYLGCDNLSEYKKGISFIVNHQNNDGSFGDYERFRSDFAQQGVDINIKWYLHTTTVCLWALLIDSSEMII